MMARAKFLMIVESVLTFKVVYEYLMDQWQNVLPINLVKAAFKKTLY